MDQAEAKEISSILAARQADVDRFWMEMERINQKEKLEDLLQSQELSSMCVMLIVMELHVRKLRRTFNDFEQALKDSP